MKYKRLTKKDERGFYHYNCTKEEQEDCLLMENCGECYGTRVLYRLAELEDKIEQGTLIEFGYHIRKSYRNHDDQRYKIVIVEENDIGFEYDGLTREEAEKRLKELQNG